jgi:hypothetical protein
MFKYRDLDAYKACLELTLAVHPVADKLRERDAEMAAYLAEASLICTGRIARASAFSRKKDIGFWLYRSLGSIIELEHLFKLSDGLGLIERDTIVRLESLRARAFFYLNKLIDSMVGPPLEPG